MDEKKILASYLLEIARKLLSDKSISPEQLQQIRSFSISFKLSEHGIFDKNDFTDSELFNFLFIGWFISSLKTLST